MADPIARDTETLAEVLIENRDRDYPASVYKFTPSRMAEAIIASEWFAARVQGARAGETALREQAREAAALYDETRDAVIASPVGSIERRLHSALGDLAHAALTTGGQS